MSNTVCNILEAPTSEIMSEILSKDEENMEFIDFEKFAKMPKRIVDLDKKRQESKMKETDKVTARKVFNVAMELMPGFENWYTWRIKNWGTKSNAFSFMKLNPQRIHFETKSNPADGVIKFISEKYPNETFKFAYAAQIVEYPVGMFTMKNGQIINEITDLDFGDETPFLHNFASYLTEGEPYHEYVKQEFDFERADAGAEYHKKVLRSIKDSKDFHSQILSKNPNFNFYNPFEFFKVAELLQED